MSEMDIGMEMTKQSSELNSTLLANFNIAVAADFSLETLLAHQLPEFPAVLTGSLTATPTGHDALMAVENGLVLVESKKRKTAEQQPGTMSPAVSNNEHGGNTNTRKNNRLGKGKKAKYEEKVVHVRAKRGQATDSHSLAERVRREKINEKMRCLQDLVPGCHKTMGMAVMLDEIINYVHSLQNQVEFLSMELAAAASSYDPNLESKCIKKTQGTSSHVGQQMEKWAKDGYGEEDCFHLTWPL